MNNSKLWEKTLSEMENLLSKANFSTWFKDTYIAKNTDGEIHISVPNAFVKDWISTKYHSDILKSLRNISREIHSIKYVINKPQEKKREDTSKYNISHKLNSELPLSQAYIDKESNLNSRYNFETFIVGPFNELSYAAAQGIIKSLGVTYNPLFVYGNTGHGKTHLIQAIGNKVKEMDESKKVYYVTSERFVMDYVSSIQTNKVTSFKEKYRKYDVLIMDDIQFLSNKEKTQEELFHLFNTLYDNNKQIVFSSDKHPNYIPNLEERLKSRFGAGMIVDIPAPDKESRAAILRKKSQMNDMELPEDIVSFLSYSIEGNVRELEGVLNSILCQVKLKGKMLSLSEVKNISKVVKKPQKMTPPEEIIKVVSQFYNVEEKTIYEKTRKKEVIRPRQVAMYLLREDHQISYPLIGNKLGGRDHTTVIHSCEKIREELKINERLEQELNQIRVMIR